MKVNLPKNIGLWLVGAWFIITGLTTFIPALSGLSMVWAVLAIAAGIFIILGR